ncbi:MAG: hypothetical protein H6754_08415 [Candidatus Omnitrophica bacterium]|nr:hypothetical protein [Candidatus Omnitrophota bacterium]
MLGKNFDALGDRILYLTLLGSCLLHGLFLLVSYFIVSAPAKNAVMAMEIRYHSKPKPVVEERPAQIASVSDLKESRQAAKPVTRSIIEKQLSAAAFLRDGKRISESIEVPDKQPLKMANLIEKRSITVPRVASQKITNPKYVGYNDRIRDKIRNRAYFYIDDPKFEAGEIYLTFVVTADGNLKDLQIINERSRANDYLRSVGLRSVKESSPFPPFPSDLQYPELSFNVIISFEVSHKD